MTDLYVAPSEPKECEPTHAARSTRSRARRRGGVAFRDGGVIDSHIAIGPTAVKSSAEHRCRRNFFKTNVSFFTRWRGSHAT